MIRTVARAGLIPLAALLIVAGCQVSPSPAPETELVVDPCADRLHDICGQLLLYYYQHKRFPAVLSELPSAASDEPSSLCCPISGKPYVYNAKGVEVPNVSGRIVLWAPEPVHDSTGWGVTIEDARGAGPLTARVIRLPEGFHYRPSP